jgi:flagellar protein FlbD
MSTWRGSVIALTRLDGKEVVVNADHVLTVEATPDTILVLTTGHHIMVRESVREVVDLAAAWGRRVAGRAAARGLLVPLPTGAE